MAADTKRGVVPDPEIQIGYIASDGRCVCDLCLSMRRITAFSPLNLIQHLLKEHCPGLHVVTAADKAVLEAMAESRIDVDGWFIDSITEQAAGLAELARREANK